MSRDTSSMVRLALAFALAAGAGCTPLYVRGTAQCRSVGACSDHLNSYRYRDAAGAAAAYRRVAERMVQDCNALRAGHGRAQPAGAGSGTAAAWDACLRVAALQLGAVGDEGSVAWRGSSLAPDAIPVDWAAGTATLEWVCQAHLAEEDRRADGPDAERARDLELSLLGRTACGMAEDIARAPSLPPGLQLRDLRYTRTECAAQYGLREPGRQRCIQAGSHGRDADWFTPSVRLTGARAMLARYERETPADPGARAEALMRIVALAGPARGAEVQHFLRDLEARHGASRREAVGALFAELEARIRAGDREPEVGRLFARAAEAVASMPDVASAYRGRLLQAGADLALLAATSRLAALEAVLTREALPADAVRRAVTALGMIRRLDAAHRAQLQARVDRYVLALVERYVSRAAADRRYAPALGAIDALRPFVGEQVLERQRAELCAAGAAHHARLAAGHLAARRFGAARFHATRAGLLGAGVDVALADRALAEERAPALGVRPAPGCDWALPPQDAAGGGRAVAVRVEWTRCRSDERRWTTSDRYTYSAQETTMEATTVSHTETQYRCTSSLQQSCGYGGSGCRTVSVPTCQNVEVTRQETVMAPVTRTVQRPATRETERRALVTDVAAVFVVDREGGAVRVPLNPAAQELTEERFHTPHGSSEFTAATLAGQRAAVVRAVSEAVRLGGAVHQALARDASRRLLEEAARLGAADAGAEDAYARAAALGVPESSPALAFLAERYGLTPEEVASALAAGR